MSALDTMVGGDHYLNLAIKPMDYSMANKLDACQHTAIKYITRFRDKDGKKDLLKAIHCIEMLIDYEYGREDIKPVLRDSLGTIFSSQKMEGGIGGR